MSNLPVNMPSQQDVSEMARLRAIMNGGSNVPAVQQPQQAHYAGGHPGTRRPMNESYSPPAPIYVPSGAPTRADVDAMKNLLETLADLSGEEQAPRQALQETSHYAAPALPSPQAAGGYSVMAMIQESGGKEVNRYNVVDAGRRDVVAGLVIKEAATAIMKLMNKGHAFESAKVQEVVELEETYNRARIQTGQNKTRYQRAADLGETAAAQVFKDRFGTSRANALAAQDDIKSINDSIR